MSWRLAGWAGLATLAMGPAGPHGVQPTPCEVRYVANAGVLVTSGATALLIDAPIRDGLPGYLAPDAADRERLERARPPYDRVAAILVTHVHDDHFSAGAIAAHLQHNEAAVLVSSDEVVDRVRHAWPAMPAGRARPTTPDPGTSSRIPIGGVQVHVLRIRHSPARVTPAQHVGFLIEGCRTVLHVGDADPAADNFAVLRSLPRVQAALVPFWFLTSRANRTMTLSAIAPAQALAIHVPPNEVDGVTSSLSSIPQAVVLSTPGQRVELK